MGRAVGTAVEAAPPIVAAPPAPPLDDDHRLVVAVRRGDDRAFEALYGRYHGRIAGYVRSMVKDHGRAEDVTQEVFLSALRRMRETDRPIAFKPWIYEIAKNACIDHFRRSQRTDEVSYDGDDAFVPGRLVGSGPTPDAAVFAKQELDHLCGAFDGLSDTHHEILVLRELEGFSYREIGERMGMSRPAVESTLFRARRRLTEEYDDLTTGARCLRIQGIIATAIEGSLGTRESRRLARHVAHCQPCRREALAAGLDSSIFTHVPLRRRAAEKLAGLLPFPGLARYLRGRGGGDETASTLAPGGAWAAHAPMLSDNLNAGWAKAAAVAALLIAGVGATGVGTKYAIDRDGAAPSADRPAAERESLASESAAAGPTVGAPAAERTGRRENGGRDAGGSGDRTTAKVDGQSRGDAGGGTGGGSTPTGPGGSSGDTGGGATGGGGDAANGAGGAGKGGGGNTGGGGNGGGGGDSGPSTPVTDTTEAVKPVVDGVTNTVNNTVGGVNQTVQDTVQGVNNTLAGVGGTLQGSPTGVSDTLQGVNDTVEGLTGGLQETVNGAGQGLNDTLNGVGGLLRPPP